MPANVELMWLLGRLYPDHKSIAEFRRMHREAVTAAGAELTIRRKQIARKDKAVYYTADKTDCSACAMKPRCTQAAQRIVTRLLDEEALNRMHARATPEAMRLRRSTVEHPFATLKYRIFGRPRLLLRGTHGAQTEISLAATAYNLKRMLNVLGGHTLTAKLLAA